MSATVLRPFVISARLWATKRSAPVALDIWFVNVGHGDFTIVRFQSGRIMMVDALDKETQDEL